MPAPAPWASTYASRAPAGRSSRAPTRPSSPTARSSSVDTGVELLQRAHEIRLLIEDGEERVRFELLHACRCSGERELPDVELGRHLAPGERHGYRRAGQRPDAERGDQQA